MNNMMRAALVAGVVSMLAGTAELRAGIPPTDTWTAAMSRRFRQAAPPTARADAGPPDLPRVTVDVPAIAVTGRTIHVRDERQPAEGAR